MGHLIRKVRCPFRRLDHFNALISAVGARSRNIILDEKAPRAFSMTLGSLARAAARQDTNLARKVLGRCPELNATVAVSNGSVLLLEPARFDDMVAGARRQEVEEATRKQAKHKDTGRREIATKSLMDRASLWAASAPRATLSAILDKNGNEIADGVQQNNIISKHWAPIFAHKEINEEAARQVASCVPAFPDGCFHLPTTADIHNTLRRLPTTAPGDDGITYAAYKCAPDFTADVLFDVLLAMVGGAHVPAPFN